MDQKGKINLMKLNLQSQKKRSKCFDVFQDFKLNNYKMYEFKPARNLVIYKIKRNKLSQFFEKIRLLKGLMGLSSLRRTILIEIMLKEIWIVKQIFILDIEQGNEVIIPPQLSQTRLALSYKFYDPILNIIQANISEEMRSQFALRNSFNLERIKENFSMSTKLFESFRGDQVAFHHGHSLYKKNDTVGHSPMDGGADKDAGYINIMKNIECTSLQTSRYIIIENDIKKLRD